jgi:hypothetical protein
MQGDVLSYTDQPNGSTIVCHRREGTLVFSLQPMGQIFGYHSIGTWLLGQILWSLVWFGLLVGVASLIQGRPTAIVPCAIGLVVMVFFNFIDDWIVKSRSAEIELAGDVVRITKRVPTREGRELILRRTDIADVRVTFAAVRVCTQDDRTLARVDCCGKGDLIWLRDRLRHELDLAPSRPTLWQIVRDFCRFEG